MKFGIDLGTPPKTTLDEFRSSFGAPFSPKKGPLELHEAKKDHLEKVSFSHRKTIFSRLRGSQNALEIIQNEPKRQPRREPSPRSFQEHKIQSGATMDPKNIFFQPCLSDCWMDFFLVLESVTE